MTPNEDVQPDGLAARRKRPLALVDHGHAAPGSYQAPVRVGELSAEPENAPAAYIRRCNPLVVVPCSRAKLDIAAPAGSLYTGPLHAAARRAAERLWARRVLVLLARYGLVDLDTVIESYDLTMGEPGSVTTETLGRQAVAMGEPPNTPVVVLLLPRAYAQAVAPLWPGAREPLAGARSRGELLRRLAALQVGDQ